MDIKNNTNEIIYKKYYHFCEKTCTENSNFEIYHINERNQYTLLYGNNFSGKVVMFPIKFCPFCGMKLEVINEK